MPQIVPHPFSSTAAFAGEARRMLALAWPVMLTNLNWAIMSFVDVLIVGRVSTEELAALGAARAVNWVFIVMGMAALSGVLVYTSRADGGGRLAETGDSLRQGLILALFLGVPSLLTMAIFGRLLLELSGVAPALVDPGAQVLFAFALGLPGVFLLTAASYFLEGISRPQRVMAVNLFILPLNALLDWLIAPGNLGFPAWGAFGAALATSFSVSVGAVLLLIASWRLPRAGARKIRSLAAAHWLAALRAVPGLLRFGAMPALAAGLELAGFSYLIVLSTQLGLIPAAAFQVILAMHSLTFAMALGLASAAGVRVGNAMGAGQAEQALARTLIAALGSLTVTMPVILLLALLPEWIVAGFSRDGEVRALAAVMLAMLAPFMLFDGLQALFVAALRSMEDQIAAGLISITAFGAVLIGVALWFLHRGAGADALIYAFNVSMVVAALLQFARLLWVSRRRDRPSPPPTG
jgi:MATE family multidrug resistance protein